ncbi:GyrI-like domain-containing protein [Nocardia sp. CNY236]|uniref:GyrI-like domain-containing protein n=1 Tax=Nocardia sp. CNY236 TaxID=1169152 RepID=UPI000417641E|nr:GyrI-like domain-containing protein [Nocardia sp. CNY236]
MEILEHAGMTVMGVEVVARWEDLAVEVPQAWARLFAAVQQMPGRTPEQFVDVSLEVDDGRYRQVVGVIVDRAEPCPAAFRVVHIPAQRLLFHRHVGPVTEIASSFGAMLEWAGREGLGPTDFKLDIGYTPTGAEESHDLYVGLEPAPIPVQ